MPGRQSPAITAESTGAVIPVAQLSSARGNTTPRSRTQRPSPSPEVKIVIVHRAYHVTAGFYWACFLYPAFRSRRKCATIVRPEPLGENQRRLRPNFRGAYGTLGPGSGAIIGPGNISLRQSQRTRTCGEDCDAYFHGVLHRCFQKARVPRAAHQLAASHSSITFTISDISQSVPVTPAAIAGVIFNV
jgi:hypothetical protein